MASPCKRLCLVVLLLGCLLQAAQGEKWRGVAKMFRRCPGPPLAIELQNFTFSLKNRGTTFIVTTDGVFAKNATFTKAGVIVYKTGGIKDLLFLTWTFEDLCSKIMKGHPFVDPIFAPSALTRQCSYPAGTYPVIIDYDLHGDFVGVKARGDYMVEIKLYDHEELIWCEHVYVNVRKDTLN